MKPASLLVKLGEETLIARLSGKIDQLQFKYGIPNSQTSSDLIAVELKSIWENSNLLVVDYSKLSVSETNCLRTYLCLNKRYLFFTLSSLEF